MAFDVPEVDSPSVVSSGAQEIRTAGEKIDQKMKDASSAWQPIRGQYRAPEASQVYRAMRTPEEMATELMSAADKVGTELDQYSSELAVLKQRREALLGEIGAYQAANVAADLSDPAVLEYFKRWEAELHRKCFHLRVGVEKADSECATSIRSAAQGAGDGIGETLLNAIFRNNNVEGALGTLFQVGRLGADSVKYGSMAYFVRNGRVQLRQGWAPQFLQNLAGRGKFGEGLARILSKWDASAVTNNGQFLAKNSPMNPMAHPKGPFEALQTVIARSTLKLDGKNSRIPNAGHGGKGGTWDRVAKGSKIASHTGNVLSFATSTVESWQTDSSTHPNMGTGEKGTRAVVSGGFTAGGGWAGGKAGASIGAAVGSFAGPVGTVAGGVAGGIIGGIAGSKAGGWIGDKAKDLVSALFN